MIKTLRYGCEALLLYTLYFIFRIMPVDWASALGGRLLRFAGPKLRASKKARDNLAQVFPNATDTEKQQILAGMWENLGRVLAEYPHLDYIVKNRVTGRDLDLLNHIKTKNVPAFFISGHIANWEILPLFGGQQAGYIHSLYRAPNNPLVDRLLTRIRDKHAQGLIPKSRSGTRKMVKVLKNKGNIGLLFDQKYNEGVPVPFFGKDAMTGDAFIHLARKYDAQVIPATIRRDKGVHFTLTIHDPLDLYDAQGQPRDTVAVLKDAHEILEKFIRETPGQWLWLHRRWPKTPQP